MKKLEVLELTKKLLLFFGVFLAIYAEDSFSSLLSYFFKILMNVAALLSMVKVAMIMSATYLLNKENNLFLKKLWRL